MKSSLLALSLISALVLMPLRAASAGETIKWPNPWEAGRTLVYETENIDSETQADKRKKVRTGDTTEIRIIEASGEGFVQSWVSTDTRLEVLAGDKAEGEMMITAMKSFEGFPLMVELDKEASYRRIRNLDAVVARLRTALRPVLVASVEAEINKLGDTADADKEKQTLAAAMKKVEGVLDNVTAAPVVEVMLGRVIQTYNSFVGVELEDGERYTLETELDNPLGGKKFPATMEFGLYASEENPADIFIEWETTIDPKKGMDAVWDLTESLLGIKITKADRKGLPKQISLVDDGFIIFNRDSGVIEMFESTRTVKLGEKLKVDRNRMRLTNGDHKHTWTVEADPEETVAGDKSAERMRLCADHITSPEDTIAACTSLSRDGKLDEATQAFVFFNRAQAYDLLGRYDEALKDFDQVIRLQPNNAMAFGYRGAVHGKKGELDAAISDTNRALVLNPKDADAHANRATALEKKGEYDESLRSYSQAIKLLPESTIALGGRCWVGAVMKKNLELALSDCSKAIALDGRDSNLYNSRGFAYYRLNQYDKSIQDYDTAIAGNPKVASSFYIRGLAKRARGAVVAGDADVAAGIALDLDVVARYRSFGVDSP